MSLAHAILAVLSAGPRHAYLIRAGAADLLGPFVAVNQGQVYSTLGRLATRGLVEAEPFDPGGAPRGDAPTTAPSSGPGPGATASPCGATPVDPIALARRAGPPARRLFRCTDAGRRELHHWLETATELPGGTADLPTRLLVLLERRDPDALTRLLDGHRTRLRGLMAAVERIPLREGAEGWLAREPGLRACARQAVLAHLDAELAWLETATELVARQLAQAAGAAADVAPGAGARVTTGPGPRPGTPRRLSPRRGRVPRALP